MKRLLAVAALTTLVAACSTSLTTSTTLPPTTAPQETPRIVVGDMTGLPNDSADLAVGQLILDFRGELTTFVEFLDPPTMSTIGDLVDSADEHRPKIEGSLDRMAAMNDSLRSYVGDDDVSASQDNLRELTDVVDIWIDGQRQQNDPKVICIDQIPASTRDQPIESIGENKAYVACFTEFLDSDLVAERFRAAERIPDLMDVVYSQTIAG